MFVIQIVAGSQPDRSQRNCLTLRILSAICDVRVGQTVKKIVGGAVLLKDHNYVLNLLCCRTGRCLTGGCLTSPTSATTPASAPVEVHQEGPRAEDQAKEQHGASADRSDVKVVHASNLAATSMRSLFALGGENDHRSAQFSLLVEATNNVDASLQGLRCPSSFVDRLGKVSSRPSLQWIWALNFSNSELER